MIIGNPDTFAVESSITHAYARPSLLGLGFFVIYAGGLCYGNRSPKSTMLACSYDEVGRRIAGRGSHSVPFGDDPDAGKIAESIRGALYGLRPEKEYFGLPLAKFSDSIHSQRVIWAPDGDEAFDDGSYVLQMDNGKQVRLIAFKNAKGTGYDPATLTDIRLPGDHFYCVLQSWRDAFLREWTSMPKVRDDSPR